MKKNSLNFLVLFAVSLTLLVGCGGGGGGGGGGSVVTNPAAPTETATPANPTLVGNSTVTASLAIPADSATLSNIRAAAAQAYGVGKLFVDGELFQTKTVNVSNNALTFTFTGVKDSGTAKIEIELFNCHVYGVTKFEKSGAISASLTLTPDKIFPADAKKTADGRVLKELPGTCYGGWLTFNELGQPIGKTSDNYIQNYSTGQKYFKWSDLAHGAADIAYLNGDMYLSNTSAIYKITNYSVKSDYIGVYDTYGKITDGVNISAAKISGVTDMQVINNKLYFQDSQYGQILRVDGNIITVVTDLGVNFDRFTITEDGSVFALNYPLDANTSAAVRVLGNAVAEVIYTADTSAGNTGMHEIPETLVKYGNSYLISAFDKIYLVNNGVKSVWLAKSDIAPNHFPKLRIYKNANGHVFVTDETLNKIWLVQ